MMNIFEIALSDEFKWNKKVVFPSTLISKWQNNLEDMARITRASVNLILLKSQFGINVCISNKSSKALFSKGESVYGYINFFSNMAIETDSMVLVPDVTRESQMHSKFDVIHGLRSYLGFPLHWWNRSVIGVICSLSEQLYHFKLVYEMIMEKQKNNIEADLRSNFL